jgi:hypothetical protein
VWTVPLILTSIKPDLEEEIRVVEKIENRLKICCIYHYGRKSGEDTNNNSPKRKDAFDVLMKRNLTKFPCEITEEVGSKFTGKWSFSSGSITSLNISLHDHWFRKLYNLLVTTDFILLSRIYFSDRVETGL